MTEAIFLPIFVFISDFKYFKYFSYLEEIVVRKGNTTLSKPCIQKIWLKKWKSRLRGNLYGLNSKGSNKIDIISMCKGIRICGGTRNIKGLGMLAKSDITPRKDFDVAVVVLSLSLKIQEVILWKV